MVYEVRGGIPKTDVTRKEFLRWVATGLGTVAGGSLLGACGGERPSTPADAVSPPTTAPPPGPTAAVSTPATTAVSASPPDLVVTRGGEPEELVRRALAALGGIERFVRPGDDVIIKPNICVAYHTYEYAATTNPWVERTKLLRTEEARPRRWRARD